MENKSNYSYSSTGNPVPHVCNPYKKKYLCDVFSEISNLEVEESPISLLSVLFMMSGFLLFIYGLFMINLYQFVMGFIFLISGLILDSTIKSETRGSH